MLFNTITRVKSYQSLYKNFYIHPLRLRLLMVMCKALKLASLHPLF